MIIRNINGTAGAKCSCGSLLEHWKNFSCQAMPVYCPVQGCLKMDLFGALVQRGYDSTDLRWYVFPLCSEHNRYSGELEVSDLTQFVSADKKETCGKK